MNGKTVIFVETPQKKHIWLVGTAHISKKSAEEVRAPLALNAPHSAAQVKEVIQAVRPDTVVRRIPPRQPRIRS